MLVAQLCIVAVATIAFFVACTVKMPASGIPACVSVALYALSLCLPVGAFANGPEVDFGYTALFLGWLRIFCGGFDWLSWFANVPYAIAVLGLFSRNLRMAWIAGLLATGLSLVILIPFGTYDTYNSFDDYVLYGYWVWVASIALVPATSFALMREPRGG